MKDEMISHGIREGGKVEKICTFSVAPTLAANEIKNWFLLPLVDLKQLPLRCYGTGAVGITVA